MSTDQLFEANIRLDYVTVQNKKTHLSVKKH